jgi:hypothetical protein
MPDPTPVAYSLVPWVRRGLTSLVTTGTASQNYVTLPVEIDVNGKTVPAPPIRLLGPGDITSMDTAAIIRTDPRDGANAFEPNYLAMVELALPDLPWLFTPAAPDGSRLRPWICLVVIAENDSVAIDVPPSGPAVLNLKESVAELPDLGTIDAWAHAQVIGDNLSGAALNAALDGNQSARLGRLVSPRKLEPNVRYVACIVPTYRAGVHAGLGVAVDDQDLAQAWDANTTAPFQLPIYYYFRFQTGPGGDFASLAARIKPPAANVNAGKRNVDVSGPGFGAAAAPGVTLDFATAPGVGARVGSGPGGDSSALRPDTVGQGPSEGRGPAGVVGRSQSRSANACGGRRGRAGGTTRPGGTGGIGVGPARRDSQGQSAAAAGATRARRVGVDVAPAFGTDRGRRRVPAGDGPGS